jgi:hypothetical protein
LARQDTAIAHFAAIDGARIKASEVHFRKF